MRLLQSDVCMDEETELRQLESGAPVAGCAEPPLAESGVAAPEDATRTGELASAQAEVTGAVVQGATQRAEQLSAKKFENGGFRESEKISRLQPRGSAGLKSKVPKRKDFGAEGDEGDAAHAAAMKDFSIAEFGSSHVQARTIDERMSHVALFGYWAERNKYGKFVEWSVSHGGRGMERCLIAVERDGSPRVPSDAAMMEYVLAMATGDVESRPKGGFAEYQKGEHVKPGLHGRKRGDMPGKQKAFGKGQYADAPFRFRTIEVQVRGSPPCRARLARAHSTHTASLGLHARVLLGEPWCAACAAQVHAIRWFFDVLIEKLGGGALNPASTGKFKQLMKALSYLMGQRRVYMPKALTRNIVEAVCRVADADSVDQMKNL